MTLQISKELNEEKLERYSRHIKLKEIGVSGQKKLEAAKVLVVGAGGLGSPVLQYLSAAGIGKIGIIDNDKVELSNLQRQILYQTNDVGKRKVEVAYNFSKSINPNVKIFSYPYRLEKNNIRELIKEYDFIADGSDNFETRFIINDICFFEKKTLVSASSIEKEIKKNKTKKIEKSNLIGEILAKRAKEKKITEVYFDRGEYRYHGRIKTFAETLRKNGLKF